MKSITPALAAHHAQDTTTLATCWKVTLRSGLVLGFTSSASDIIVDGVRYEARSGMSGSDVTSHSDGAVDELEAMGLIDSARISEIDLATGVWDGATVETFTVNYQSPTDGKLKQRNGVIGEPTIKGRSFRVEVRGLAQRFQQQLGRTTSPTCDAKLGDARCTKVITPVTGSVTSVIDRRTFIDSSASQPDDYFGGGILTWTGGANAGRQMEVSSYFLTSPASQFKLVLEMPKPIAVGDTYSCLPGCRKRLLEDCKTKFNNVVNFRGFPYIPGIDHLLKPGGV